MRGSETDTRFVGVGHRGYFLAKASTVSAWFILRRCTASTTGTISHQIYEHLQLRLLYALKRFPRYTPSAPATIYTMSVDWNPKLEPKPLYSKTLPALSANQARAPPTHRKRLCLGIIVKDRTWVSLKAPKKIDMFKGMQLFKLPSCCPPSRISVAPMVYSFSQRCW